MKGIYKKNSWWIRTSRQERRFARGMTLMGIMCLGGSLFGFWDTGLFVPAIGMALLGLGLTAAGGSFLACCYCTLTPEGGFRAALIGQSGLMVLGPAALLFFRPWKSIADGNLTMGQCVWICIGFCGATLIPFGISLIRLIWTHREKR